MIRLISADLMKIDNLLYSSLFALIVLITLIPVFISTPFYISDIDGTTYVIIPLLLLPFLAFLSIFIEKVKIDKLDYMLSFLFFAFYIIILFISRFYFSFLFFSYKIYMLIYPIFLFSIIFLFYGRRNINKFKTLIIISLFASPMLLLYVLALNPDFAYINSIIVFDLLHLSNSNVNLNNTSISLGNNTADIGISCVNLGFFIALFLFFIGIFEVFNEDRLKKLYLVIIAIVILFLLNLFRLYLIAYGVLFDYENISNNISNILLVHEYFGQIIFYLSIIIVLILSFKPFHLKFKTAAKRKFELNRAFVFGLIFSLIILIFNIDIAYVNSFSSIYLLNYTIFNLSNKNIAYDVASLLTNHSLFFEYAPLANNSLLINYRNDNNSYLLYISYTNLLSNFESSNKLLSSSYIYYNGTLFNVLSLSSYNKTYNLVYYRRPIRIGYRTSIVDIYLIYPFNSTNATCNINYLYTYAFNLFKPNTTLIKQFCIAKDVV